VGSPARLARDLRCPAGAEDRAGEGTQGGGRPGGRCLGRSFRPGGRPAVAARGVPRSRLDAGAPDSGGQQVRRRAARRWGHGAPGPRRVRPRPEGDCGRRPKAPGARAVRPALSAVVGPRRPGARPAGGGGARPGPGGRSASPDPRSAAVRGRRPGVRRQADAGGAGALPRCPGVPDRTHRGTRARGEDAPGAPRRAGPHPLGDRRGPGRLAPGDPGAARPDLGRRPDRARGHGAARGDAGRDRYGCVRALLSGSARGARARARRRPCASRTRAGIARRAARAGAGRGRWTLDRWLGGGGA